MEGPGTSLFQGSDALKINTTNPEEEEAEAFEEDARRNAQLRELLSSAFDDLQIDNNDESFASSGHHMMNTSLHSNENGISEDEPVLPKFRSKPLAEKLVNGTVNGSGDTALSAHYKHCYHNNPDAEDSKSDEQLESLTGPTVNNGGGDIAQLAELYGVRVREIARLQEQSSAREERWRQQYQLLEQRLLQMEAEKKAAQTSSEQAQSLLVTGKEQIAELLRDLETVKQKNRSLEVAKEDLERELMVSRTTVDSLQARISVLERGSSQRANEVQADALLRSVQDRHKREMANLQQQLDAASSKLETTESSLRQSERRVWEVTRGHEAMLLERGEAVNRLARALEESQRHCQQLVEDRAAPGISALKEEKQQLQAQLAKTERELERARMDIDQLETTVGLGVLTSDPGHDKERGKTGLDSMERLREELARSLRNQEARRADVRRLNEELRDREQELSDMRQQESKYEQVVAKLKAESERLLNQAQTQRLSQTSNEEATKLRQEVAELRGRNCELEAQLEYLEGQNAALAEQAVELQRACDEDKLRTIDNHSSEYLAFHQRAVAIARQQEREQAEAVARQTRAELEEERRAGDEVKRAYVDIAQAKAGVTAQLQQQMEEVERLTAQLQQQREAVAHLTVQLAERGPPKKDISQAELEQRLRAQYEQKVAAEVEKAKQAVLGELARERQTVQVQNGGQDLPQGEQELVAEVSRLRQVLADQTENLQKERREIEEQAWSHFQAELQRVAEHQTALSSQPLPGGTPPKTDRATSPVSHDTTDYETKSAEPREDLHQHVEFLQSELEKTKTKHANRLADLQTHLQDKHQEMEDFKKKIIEYTKLQVESQEKDTVKYISALKREIESLTTELNENKKISDLERVKLNGMMESWVEEIRSLKDKKKQDETRLGTMTKKVADMQENLAQVKDYYERRETFLRQEHRKREERCFETLLKLKSEIDTLGKLEFPRFVNPAEPPTKDS